jgi:hypothetical protein
MQITFKFFVSFLFCLVLLVVGGCSNNNDGGLDSLVVDSAFAQSGGEIVTRWEYKIVKFYGGGEDTEQQFNQLGLEGWELVSYVSTGNYYVCFKRPKR